MTDGFDFAAFDRRLVTLGVTTDDLAAAIDRDARTVDRWREGRGTPDAGSMIRLRPILASEEAAQAAVERVRTRSTRDLRGEDAERAKARLQSPVEHVEDGKRGERQGTPA